MHDWIEIQHYALRADPALEFVGDENAGAIAAFEGITRAETHPAGHKLKALQYEAYEEMALKQLHDLAVQARQRWPILRLAILHRVGAVHLGDTSVVIAVSSAHRSAAFDACRWIIDTLKAEVAIWKKEVWSDGTQTWVEPGDAGQRHLSAAAEGSRA